jgi:hypothetical protein
MNDRVLTSYINYLIREGRDGEARDIASFVLKKNDPYLEWLYPYAHFIISTSTYLHPPNLKVERGFVCLEQRQIGQLRYLHFKPLPSETRMEIAYKYLYDSIIGFLIKCGFGILEYDKKRALVFQPNGLKLEDVWGKFINTLNSEDFQDMLEFYTGRGVSPLKPFSFSPAFSGIYKSFITVLYLRQFGIFDEYSDGLRKTYLASVLGCSENDISNNFLEELYTSEEKLLKAKDIKLRVMFERLKKNYESLGDAIKKIERNVIDHLLKYPDALIEALKKHITETCKNIDKKYLDGLFKRNFSQFTSILNLFIRPSIYRKKGKKSVKWRGYGLAGFWAVNPKARNALKKLPFFLELADKGIVLKPPYTIDSPYATAYQGGGADTTSDYCFICGEERGVYPFKDIVFCKRYCEEKECQKCGKLFTVKSLGESSDFRPQSTFVKTQQPFCFQCYFASLYNPLHFKKYISIEISPKEEGDFLATLIHINKITSSFFLAEKLGIYPIGRFIGISSPYIDIGLEAYVIHMLSRFRRWDEMEGEVNYYSPKGRGMIPTRRLILLSKLRQWGYAGLKDVNLPELLYHVVNDEPLLALRCWISHFCRASSLRFIDNICSIIYNQFGDVSMSREEMRDVMGYAYLLHIFVKRGDTDVDKSFLFEAGERVDNIPMFLRTNPNVMYGTANPKDIEMPFLTRCLKELTIEINDKLGVDVAKERSDKIERETHKYLYNVDTLLASCTYLFGEKYAKRLDEFKERVRNTFLVLFPEKFKETKKEDAK